MKLKARDIIEGWPRGRSTVPSVWNEQWKYFLSWPLFYQLSDDMVNQLYKDVLYHVDQYAMVHNYFATYRRTPNEFEAYILKHWACIEQYDPEEGKRVARESVLAAERLRNMYTWGTNANVSASAKTTHIDYDLLRKLFGQ